MELRVTECCKKKGLTLQDLADKLGVARSTLANTLTKNNPTLETLEKIANALEVKVCDLLDEDKASVVCPNCGHEIPIEVKIKNQ